MEQLLLDLLLKLEPIWEHDPFNDRSSGGKMLDSIFGLFVSPQPGYELPHDFGLSAEENVVIRDALRAYTDAARALAPTLGIDTFYRRLAAFQNGDVCTVRGQLSYVDIFGHCSAKQFDVDGNVIRPNPPVPPGPSVRWESELKVGGRVVRPSGATGPTPAAEWQSTTDPTVLLRHLDGPYRRGELGERKFILFAAACCRRVWDLIADPRSRAGVEAAERYADKFLSLEDAQAACEESRLPIPEAHARLTAFEATPPAVGPEWAALGMALHTAMAANEVAACSNSRQALNAAWRATFATCCRECPDVYDPGLLTPVTTTNRQGQTINFPPPWYPIVQRERAAHCDLVRDVFGNPFRPAPFDPTWRTETAVALSRGMYDDRAFDQMPMLAEALQDAGCGDADILGHCRGVGPHVRGCWVVDLVLGWDVTA